MAEKVFDLTEDDNADWIRANRTKAEAKKAAKIKKEGLPKSKNPAKDGAVN